MTWTPAQLPGLALWTDADSGYATFQAARFNANLQYLSSNPPASWAGASRFTLCGYVLVLPQHNSLFSVCGLNDGAGTNCCFWVGRLSTAGNSRIQVSIAASLTDTGAQHAVGSVAVLGNNDPSIRLGSSGAGQGWTHIGFVFDGIQVGNAARLRLYVNGVRDPSPTFTGTIPAALTSPAGASKFLLGYDLFQGAAAGLQNVEMYNWAALAGYAASDAEMAALANLAAGSKYPQPYGFASLPVGAPAAASFTHFWQLSESSTGSAPVTRGDSKGNNNLSDGTGAGGNVPSVTLATEKDLSGNANHGTSCTRVDLDAHVCAAPTLLAADINGHNATHHSTAVNINAPFRYGQFGLTTNPAGMSACFVVSFDALDSAHEMSLCGSDLNDGVSQPQNASASCWGEMDNDDFGIHPGPLLSASGDGGNHNAWYTAAGAVTAGSYAIVLQRFNPGNPGATEIWVNGIRVAVASAAATQLGLGYAEVKSLGGTFAEWSFAGVGNTDQAAGGPPAGWMGKKAFQVVGTARWADTDLSQLFNYLSLRYAIAVPAAPPPPAPGALVASSAPGIVALQWSAVAAVDGYTVYRGTRSGSESPYAAGLTTNSYVDSACVSGVTYFYRVTATILGAASAPSNEVSAAALPVAAATAVGVFDVDSDTAEAIKALWDRL